ncbi:hypothetical protein B484DRAFT_450452 [Ochromonadaceae sp. CCMP2298]|nr:hypothetical protein B484DRAFT_450452 [Ochromonadaceae sp. CCMP2298]|mmetsp:Transcript_33767/g.74353  ORF Transcript_33767/g.74353 Transcript_33767/m.74353 type:complete len:328 (+) Transcript_33767:157-1140(+)
MEDLDLNNYDGNIDDSDFCRGYGAVEGSVDFEQYSAESAGGGNAPVTPVDENDSAPPMPVNFYEGLDSFLMKGPPKLNESSGLVKKKKAKQSRAPGGPGLVLPDINKQEMESEPPRPPQLPSKVRSKIAGTKRVPAQTRFDHGLLQEAFAYTDKLLQDNVEEEAGAGRDGGRSAPAGAGAGAGAQKVHRSPSGKTLMLSRAAVMETMYRAVPSSNQPGAKKKASVVAGGRAAGAAGAVSKLKGKVRAGASTGSGRYDAGGGGFATTDASDSSKRSAATFDDLVANFRDGVMLQKLRQELEQSKTSMAKSETFMRELSKEYLGNQKQK